uniref:Kinase suppressor of ras 2 n=1 Tax=Oryzias sinensis TaxID=183150 RepID=A0A8C7Z587_9TELE
MNEEMTKSEEQHLSLQKALQQCELVQNMIDISISSLEGLRTKCATSNDLTQKEIRTLEVSGSLTQLLLCILNQIITQGCQFLQATLHVYAVFFFPAANLGCWRLAHSAGGSQAKQDWSIQWPTSESGKENTPVCQPEASQWIRFQLSQSPKVQSKYNQHMCQSPQALTPSLYADRLTVDSPASGLFPLLDFGHRSLPPSPRQRHFGHTPPRTPLVVNTMTPPGTPPMRRRNKVKAPGTPPPPSRKLIHLLPGFTALHRSKSHEFQLGNRLDDTPTPKAKKKTKPLNLKIHSSVGSCENLPTQRSPLHTERSLRSFFFPTFIPSTPPVHAETPSANTLSVPRWSPQIPRRDLGNSIKHRFSTKYWMSQTCIVCGKGMLFGLKCKNCKLKCHNKCTKEAPPCHLLIIQRARLVRTESVPCDINNPLRYTDLHISQTLPKTNKINKDHISVPYQPDSSSNPSSTTSSTPSSPAPPLPSSATPPSPLHPSPQSARQQKQFNLTDVTPEVPPSRAPQVILHPVLSEPGLCKGRTLYSVVRDAKVALDVNKTRQIAQEMVKGMGYLHAKGILHKDMKSKNVFYDNGKVVITDFGLFTISGVLQAGSRREDKLRIPSGWLCHLAPEIIQQLSPDTEEDKLPFSKQSDVFAFGTIWYELHAREWPYKSQPAEVIIWQIGSGMKPNLAQTGMGKEILDILLLCWAYKQEERPTFSKLVDLLEKLPKRNRRLSHPGHFWKSAEYVK